MGQYRGPDARALDGRSAFQQFPAGAWPTAHRDDWADLQSLEIPARDGIGTVEQMSLKLATVDVPPDLE